MLKKYYNDKFNIEYTLHNPSKNLLNTVKDVFKISINDYCKNNNLNFNKVCNTITIIPTWQKSNISLLQKSDDVDHEMDRLYLNFKSWLDKIKMNNKDMWIDASSPHTGKPIYGTCTNFTYNELESLKTLLKYDNEPVGCCGMIYHPEYQDKSYPITLFTNIDENNLIKELNP